MIGPDEYHEDVDDNVFTNVMVRHNLELAADVVERFGGCDRSEIRARLARPGRGAGRPTTR